MFLARARAFTKMPSYCCRFSTEAAQPKKKIVNKTPVAQNVSLAIMLLAFVGGVYYTAINKMRQDDFTKIIEEDKAEQAEAKK
mmetsp:Transcript_61018/g.120120  ORF Transcript_61018/g.120120 Transcript_61018/m.120120 type:complete len:83 (-) Transcript_61018:195-443(-)